MWATDLHKTQMRVQDHESNDWYYMTISIIERTLDNFKAAAIAGQGSEGMVPIGTQYVLDWELPRGGLHCVYAYEWLPNEGKVRCINSWGTIEPEPIIGHGNIASVYSVDVILQEEERGDLFAMSTFPNLRSEELEPQARQQLSYSGLLGILFEDVDESIAPDEPLSTLQPEFTAGYYPRYTVSGGTLLHKLAAQGDMETLQRRKEELTPSMLAATCTASSIYHGNRSYIYLEASPLWLACMTRQLPSIPGLLVRAGAPPNSLARTSTGSRMSPLWAAAFRDSMETVNMLLDNNADPNIGLAPAL